MTVVFDDPARHAEHFEAGRVLTLEVTINGERVRRACSLAAAPCDGGLAITVKRVAGGLMSNWIHNLLSEGDSVRCFGPSGDFAAGPPPAQGPRRLLLIAGGSGIVPLQAVARQVLHDEPDAAITRVYGSSVLERAILRRAAATAGAARCAALASALGLRDGAARGQRPGVQRRPAAAPAVCISRTALTMWRWTSPIRSRPKPGLVARCRPAWCGSPARAAFACRELDPSTHTRPYTNPADP